MNVEQRKRAGHAVDERIVWLGESRAAVARAAGISERTLRSLVRGDHWPSLSVRERLEPVLRWRAGEIIRRAVNGDKIPNLDSFSDAELASELAKRLIDRESHEARLRASDMR